MAGVSASVRGPSFLLLVTRCGFVSRRAAFAITPEVAAIPAVAAITTLAIPAETTAVAVAETAAAIVTLAVAVDLAHHHRGTFLELLDAHRQVAQHFLVEPLLPLDLV